MKVVRSVDRAVAILFHVADCEYLLGLSEISRLTGFDKATCLRLMNTLEMHGLICQETNSRHYKLGPGISRLTYGFSIDLRYLAPPLLRQLWLEAKESICLNYKRDLARMVVDVLPASHEFSIVPAVGSSLPVYLGASGKALIAYLSDQELSRIIAETQNNPMQNEYVIPDIDVLTKQIRYVRRNGFAWGIGDVFPGSAAVSVPVVSRKHEITASVTLRGPAARLNRKTLLSLAPIVKTIADQLGNLIDHEAQVV
jgi:DNA-binding IclR family transcriptional regulator